MNAKYVVGVDLGGTKILTALADSNGKIVERVRVDTGAQDSVEVVVQRINDTVLQVIEKAGIEKDEVARVGVGTPGPLDIEKMIVLTAPNLNWINVPLVEMMEKELGLTVSLENDANAAALAEHAFGAGKGSQHMVYMTISTGVGGGVIINGQILHGAGVSGGEIGHHTIDPDGPLCGCGNYGCLEAMASGTALGRYARDVVTSGRKTMMSELVENTDQVDGSIVTKAAEAGDDLALVLVDLVARNIGIGVANLINIFNPEKIVLGGGVMKAGHLFIDRIKNEAKKRSLKDSYELCEIVFSELGSDVGVLGAIAVALHAGS